jgi:hypothetical protein
MSVVADFRTLAREDVVQGVRALTRDMNRMADDAPNLIKVVTLYFPDQRPGQPPMWGMPLIAAIARNGGLRSIRIVGGNEEVDIEVVMALGGLRHLRELRIWGRGASD